jgi:DNA-binding CsgD family transcriptional regulator
MRDWINQVFTGLYEDASAGDEAALERLQDAGIDYRRSYFAWYLASSGRLADARASGERLAAILDGASATGGGIRLTSAFARHALAIAAAARGDPGGACAGWARARPEFGDHHVLVAFTLLDELRDVALTYGAGDPSVRRRLAAEAGAALARAGGALRPGVSPSLAWVRCLIMDGRWNEALQILDDLPPPGNPYLRQEMTGTRAWLARHRGQPDVAWVQIRPLLPHGPATAPGDIIHQEGLFLQRLAADLCLDAGDLPGAENWLVAHDRWLAWSGAVLGQAEGQLAWGQFHRAAGDLEQARSHLTNALNLATTPDQPLVRLGAHRLLGEIDGAAGNLAEAEVHLGTALTLADTCDVPFERALTLLALATVHAVNATGDSAAFVEAASGMFSTLGAAPAQARATALAARLTDKQGAETNRSGLTRRELDVLRLVADGRSNPEIAEALFISRETARTHVSNIFRKLDVGTRAEAVDHAHRHDLLSSLPPSVT